MLEKLVVILLADFYVVFHVGTESLIFTLWGTTSSCVSIIIHNFPLAILYSIIFFFWGCMCLGAGVKVAGVEQNVFPYEFAVLLYFILRVFENESPDSCVSHEIVLTLVFFMYYDSLLESVGVL